MAAPARLRLSAVLPFRVRQDSSEMIVRPPQGIITAVSLGLICAALLLAVYLFAGTSGSGERLAIILLAVCAVGGPVGLLALARRRGTDAEAVLRNTVDSLGRGVATFAAGRLVASSSAFAELLALSPAEVAAGRPVSEIEREEKAKASPVLDDIATQARRAEQAKQPVAIERRRPDGTILELLYSPHRADGFTLSVTDVTASRRTDEYLRHAQKMEALGQMTGGIAHDFNNFLTVIILNLDFLQHDKGLGEKQARRLRLALDAAFRGSKVVRQLLAFARKQPLEPEVVVLAELMPGLVELVRRAVGDDIEVEFVSSFSLWHTVLDPLQLEAAILNIALNAAAAMPNGGKLTVELANVSLDEAYAARHPEIAPGQYMLIALSDTGTGMAPDVVARAFDPFFTTKPDGPGSGLGLSMVYGFVRQSGGHIKIYSEPGHGTSVKLYFKRSHDEMAPRSESRQAVPLVGKETILVVEDDETLRTTVAATLRELGYSVLEAPHGAAALILLESSNRVDLLFTDVVMPGPVSSGSLVTAAEELQPSIKILFTSGYTQNAIIHHGRLEPGINFLSKPYRKAQLAQKVRELLATETV
jgi:signal transduction histidine kinase/ActR/RegA family two-component response regulator